MATAAERQRAFRERQKAKGLKPVNMLLTEDEAFYLERTLQTMRKENATPALARRKNGTLIAIDV